MTTFAWLSEVFVLAPIGVAAVYAVLPAFWFYLFSLINHNLRWSEDTDLLPKNDTAVVVDTSLSIAKMVIAILIGGFLWCGMEWCRSWLFTGFPWNQLGISQWQCEWLLSFSRVTGIYGISFFVMIFNLTIYYILTERAQLLKTRKRSGVIIILGPAATMIFAVVLGQNLYRPGESDTVLKVAVVQGDIPQIREWSPHQLEHALSVYTSLTRKAVANLSPDLVIWPETAVPASLIYDKSCISEMQRLFAEIKTPLLAGSIDYRFNNNSIDHTEVSRSFNSALLFNAAGEVVDRYDKIHLVPFGEFVPFEKYLPWLVKWIGMGRSLTAGREFTVLQFKEKFRIGVNICYEDIFPEISSRFVRNGANILVCITNDAWFGESSASRQHLAHAVVRAVENGRPVVRSGNNSDSCLIDANGKVTGLIRAPNTGDPFTAGYRGYAVPVSTHSCLTFYSRVGNWFAVLSFVLTIVTGIWCFYRYLDRKRRLYRLITKPSAGDLETDEC